jgi:hypothetical protein
MILWDDVVQVKVTWNVGGARLPLARYKVPINHTSGDKSDVSLDTFPT